VNLPALPLEWFFENGCELQRPAAGMLSAIYLASYGQPCRECNCKDTCPAWPKVQRGPAFFAAVEARAVDTRPRCRKCQSLLNPVKVKRRGGKCACGEPSPDRIEPREVER
jgi:hypothetical protein